MDENESLIIKQAIGKLTNDVEQLKNKFNQQMLRMHYQKKEQIELTSIWNQANRYAQLEIEIGKNMNYFNNDGTLNKFYLEERLNEIIDFLMIHYIGKEKSYRGEYFQKKSELKNDNKNEQ